MFVDPPTTPDAEAYWQHELATEGYVSNWQRAWAWRPDVADGFAVLRKQLMERSALTPRELAVLVCAATRALGDSYCALAWGTRLAALGDADLAGAVLRGAHASGLSAREAALLAWADHVVRDPNGTTSEQIEALRRAGLDDRQIFEATTFIAFRLAFSTVNDALGAQPDRQLLADAPAEVRAAVTWGRPPAK